MSKTEIKGFSNTKIALLASAVLLLAALIASPVTAAEVGTDKADYAPWETVTIDGSGFAAGTVEIYVTWPDMETYQILPPAVADENGCFTAEYSLTSGPLGYGLEGLYTLTATDAVGQTASTTFTDASPVHNVNFATSGLPSGVSITVSWSKINPAGHSASGSTTFTSPGPSADQGTQPEAAFTYSGFPDSVTIDGVTYNLQTASPSSPFNTGAAGDSTTITATYTPESAANSPPEVAADSSSVTVNEGDKATNTGTVSDPDGDAVTLVASIGDVTDNNDGTWGWSYVTADGPDQSQDVVITADDGNDDGVTTVSFQLTVNNVPPTLTIGGAESVDEGREYTLSLSSSDPGQDTITGWSITWGDGAVQSVSGNPSSVTHTYADGPNTYTISASATDEDGTFNSDGITVAVNNVAPTATFGNDGPVDEGSSFTLSLTDPYDPSSVDTEAGFEYAFDCGSGYGDFSASDSVSCPTTDNGVVHVKGKISDKDGGVSEYEADVTVNNVPPTITSITCPVNVVAVNTPVSMSATFTDPGTADTHTATWVWGEGLTTAGTVAQGSGSGSVSDSHTYTAAGIYTVTLTVTDDDCDSDTESYQYVVVYDPSAGFVTGGGWIQSPEGAYADDTTLTGKATFGFVSKYQKGAKVPTGNTEFQFKAGNLNFHSSNYEWMVVSGAKATYKGTGTINGEGDYGFMLTAIDAALTPSTDVDQFRIKIWDRTTDSIIYDNKMGAADDSSEATAIGGGSIVIHSR
jgi:hypothetical protein